MLDAMISYLWPEAMPSLTFVGEERDPSDGEMGPDLVFATQDRYITAAALSDDEWAGMCRALNRRDLIDDPRFKTARDRSINAVERREIISAELEKWTAGEILPRLLANDGPSAQFDRTPAWIRALAPLLGADSPAILAELGYGADDIARLEREQIVRSADRAVR